MVKKAGSGEIHIDWEQLGRYFDGTLTEREQYCVEQHLPVCPGCRDNLIIRARALPFQPHDLDGAPRASTPQSLRCGWARLIGPYLAGRMAEPERIRMEDHFARCESCACQLALYLPLPIPVPSSSPRLSFPFFFRLRQWWLRWRSTARRCH